MDLQHNKRLRDEISAMRREKRSEWSNSSNGRKRFFTLTDLAEMRKRELDVRAKMGTGMLAEDELLAIAKEAVNLTNQYRASKGIRGELTWHQQLAEIGWKHSRAMGDEGAPFSHDGFNDRVSQFPFPVSGAAENLFMTAGVPAAAVAKQAVDGWINSPGHRKNLEGNFLYCGIGVYRNSAGAYYLTQLFGI